MTDATVIDPAAWLERTQPGFEHVSAEERAAIRDFALLWSLYEGTVLGTWGNAGTIVADVTSLKASGRLTLNSIREPIEHFRSRYFDGTELTYAYGMLYLRPNDQPNLVERVVRKQSDDEVEILSAVMIIVLRLRNNLFHGLKWAYDMRDQLENFRSANQVLMAVMDMHR